MFLKCNISIICTWECKTPCVTSCSYNWKAQPNTVLYTISYSIWRYGQIICVIGKITGIRVISIPCIVNVTFILYTRYKNVVLAPCNNFITVIHNTGKCYCYIVSKYNMIWISWLEVYTCKYSSIGHTVLLFLLLHIFFTFIFLMHGYIFTPVMSLYIFIYLELLMS